MIVDLTRLRNWFCSSLEDRPSEAWEDSDSNDLMRWAEECRAHTESLPTPISGQKGQNINTSDLVFANNAHTAVTTFTSFIKTPPTHIMKYFDSPAVTLFRATRLLSTFEKLSPSSRSLASNGCGWESERGREGEREKGREEERVSMGARVSSASAFPFQS